jgi:transposase
MRYIGVDLHKTNFVVCFLNERGQRRLETFPLDERGLAAFRRRLHPDDQVAVEVAQNVYYGYDRIRAWVSRVVLVDTYKFAVIAKQIRHLRHLFQARESLVEVATKLKNMGHGALVRNGIALGRSASASGPQPTMAGPVGGGTKELPGLRRLLQIHGLNTLTAIGLLSEIGDIGWFESSKQLVAYTGLATSVLELKRSCSQRPPLVSLSYSCFRSFKSSQAVFFSLGFRKR